MNKIEANENCRTIIKSVIDTYEKDVKNGAWHLEKPPCTKEELEEISYKDKELFVANLGWLLRQTRESIDECYLKDNKTAVVKYDSGYEKEVNINADSYTAIVADVAKAVLY